MARVVRREPVRVPGIDDQQFQFDPDLDGGPFLKQVRGIHASAAASDSGGLHLGRSGVGGQRLDRSHQLISLGCGSAGFAPVTTLTSCPRPPTADIPGVLTGR